MSTVTKFHDTSAGTGFNSNGDRAKQHGWEPVPPADFALRMVSKHALLIDYAYQRSDVSHTNVNYIAAHWNWACVGAIVVSDRQGQLLVIEGQHRVLAAMKRVDIDTLPCIVFKFASPKDEAAAFLAINTLRKTVTALDRHRAGHVAENDTAIEVATFLDRVGLSLCRAPSNARQTKSVGTIARGIQVHGEAIMSTAIKILQDIEMPKGLHGKTIGALCELVKRNPTKLALIAEKLRAAGNDKIEAEIRNAKYLAGAGSDYAGAKGLMRIVNMNQRTNLVKLEAE